MFDFLPPDLKQALPGFGGSILALFFIRRPPFVLLAIFIGGCVLAVYAPGVIAHSMGLNHELSVRFTGFIGFVTGLFGMAIVAKIYDLLEAINVAELGQALVDVVRKRFGG